MLLSLSTVSLTLTLQIAVPAPAPASTAAPRPADAAVPWALPQPASDPLAAGQEGRPYLGVTVDTGSGGLVVSEVAKGSAAERAGLKVGDRLRRAGDQQLGDFDDLIEAVRTAGVGRPLLLVVQRGDRELALPAVIGVRPAEGQPPLPMPPPAPPAQGLETPPRPAARSGGIAAAPAAPTLPFEVRSGLSTVPARPFLGVTLSDAGNGALVDVVVENSAAAGAGLLPGDVIVRFDGQAVQGADQLVERIRASAPGAPVSLVAIRDGDRLEFQVVLGSRVDGAESVPLAPTPDAQGGWSDEDWADESWGGGSGEAEWDEGGWGHLGEDFADLGERLGAEFEGLEDEFERAMAGFEREFERAFEGFEAELERSLEQLMADFEASTAPSQGNAPVAQLLQELGYHDGGGAAPRTGPDAAERTRLQAQLDVARAERDAARARAAELEAELDSLRGELGALRGEVQALIRAVEGLGGR